jgi:hypothetical protein
MSEVELKPCLFCGGKKLRVACVVGDYWVRCDSCNAEAAFAPYKRAAVDAWNSRPGEGAWMHIADMYKQKYQAVQQELKEVLDEAQQRAWEEDELE